MEGTPGKTWFELDRREEICLFSKGPRHFPRQGQLPVQWIIVVTGTWKWLNNF